MLNLRKKLKENSFSGKLAQMMFGVFFGLLMFQSTNAQFAVTVVGDVSPTTLKQTQDIASQTILQSAMAKTGLEAKLQDYFKYAKEAQHWIDEINKYSTMIDQNAKRFTSLRGMLGVAEQQLGMSNDNLKAVADLGRAIRVTMSLKSQYIGMIRSRLAMINDLDQRARNGIFDPQADLADLEDYLAQTMGREARARLQTRAKLAEQDPELERLTVELKKVREARASAEATRTELKNQLDKQANTQTRPRTVNVGEDGAAQRAGAGEPATVSVDTTNTIILRIGQLDQLIADLTRQESALVEKITKIVQTANGNFDNIYFTGEKWKESVDGWLAFTEAKNAEIGRMVDAYGNTDLASRPRIVPPNIVPPNPAR